MSKNKQALAAIGVLALLVVVIASLFIFNIYPQATIQGSSTLFVGQASLESSNPYLNGKAWLLTFRSGGLGQRYFGTITPQQVEGVTQGELRTTKPFTLDVTYEPTKCIYNIQSANKLRPLYTRLEMVKYSLSTCSEQSARDAVAAQGGTLLYWAGDTIPFTCYAVYYKTKSEIANLPTQPNIQNRYEIVIDVEGKTARRTIDNLGGSSGAIGDFAWAEWQGGLVTGQSCQQASGFNPSDYYASFTPQGRWIVIDHGAYDSYKSSLDAFEAENVGTHLSSSQVQTRINNINTKASTAQVSQTISSGTAEGSLSNGRVVITTDIPINFPVTTLYIKADTLGIYTPAPKANIVSVSSDCFKTGTQGIISAVIENTGNERGNFGVYATCVNPFSSTFRTEVTLNSGERRTVNLGISGTGSSQTKGTCTVFVEGAFGSTSKSSDVCVDPQITCTVPYPQKFCGKQGESDAIFQCTQGGGSQTLIEVCGANQFCEEGQCKDGNSGGGDGDCKAWLTIAGKTIIPNFWCLINNFIEKFRIVFAILAGFISGLFAALAFRSIEKKYNLATSKSIYLTLMVGLVFALGIGYLAFVYFWIAMLALLILIIIKIFL